MWEYLPEETKKVAYYRRLGLSLKETGKLLDRSKSFVRETELKLKKMGFVPPVLPRARIAKNLLPEVK